MTVRGPSLSLRAISPITGQDNVYEVMATEKRAPIASGDSAIPALAACSPSVGSRNA